MALLEEILSQLTKYWNL